MNVHERVEYLEEENRQLRSALSGPKFDYPREWKLTRAEQRLLHCLYTGKHGFRQHEALLHAVAHHEWADDNLLKVQISKVRKKLKPFGIIINTVWGEGYQLFQESLMTISEASA